MTNAAPKQNCSDFWFFARNCDIDDPRSYSRMLFANVFLLLGIVINGVLSAVYSFIGADSLLIGVHLTAFASFVLLFTYLRHTKKLPVVGHLTATLLILAYGVLLGWTDLNYDLVLLSPLVPFILLILNGNRTGLLYLGLWMLIMTPLTINGIGQWHSGQWQNIDVLRFFLMTAIATLIAFMVEYARCITAKRENKRRSKHVLHIEKLRHKSRTDALTGLYNRHYFDEMVAEHIKLRAQDNRVLSIFLIDIDEFKSYNDSYGHQKGDDVLKQVAEAIRDYVRRENDTVFRLGGEEFGGLICGRDANKLEIWLAGLIQAIDDLRIPSSPSSDHPYVSISMGVSSSIIQSKEDFDRLYKAADDGLYLAKQNGRKCAVKYNGFDQVEFLAS